MSLYYHRPSFKIIAVKLQQQVQEQEEEEEEEEEMPTTLDGFLLTMSSMLQ